MNNNETPDDINIHKKTWGKNAEEVIYGGRGIDDDDDDENGQLLCFLYC